MTVYKTKEVKEEMNNNMWSVKEIKVKERHAHMHAQAHTAD